MTEKPYGTFFGRSRSRWRLHRRASGGEIQFQPFPCPISPSQHSEFHQDSSSSSFAQLENQAKRERKREPGSSLSCGGAPISCLSFFELKDLFLVPSAFIIADRCVEVHSCVKSSNMHTSALHATGRNPREEERSAQSATRNVLACCSWPHPYYLIRLAIPPHSSSVPPPSYYRGRSRQLCLPAALKSKPEYESERQIDRLPFHVLLCLLPYV